MYGRFSELLYVSAEKLLWLIYNFSDLEHQKNYISEMYTFLHVKNKIIGEESLLENTLYYLHPCLLD
ncbi:hypothetical protein COL93_28315 [Bacillus toyonensis]|uniref:Uncharacterized protein n=1 Tax=Bacillus toyonensis TaxID=155322 RepID=A0A2B5X282_9BACI|nr:hypothetical protein COL93_28315 [Bacillus toyonensis]PHD56881.1 hypothetical protein COF40_29455 [Bacillus toyonensis]